MKKLLILLALIFAHIGNSHASDEFVESPFVGKRFWVIGTAGVNFYENCLSNINVEPGTSFIIKGSNGPEMLAVLDNGKEVCFNTSRLESPYKWFTDEDITIKDKSIIKNIKKAGIIKGASLWRKYSINDKKALSEAIIIDVKVVNKKINLTIDSDKEQFDDLNAVKEKYFTSKLPKWSNKTILAIKKGEVFLGMTKEQVIASLGLPITVNRTVGKWGVHEQLVYSESGFYVYIENGKMTSFQD